MLGYKIVCDSNVSCIWEKYIAGLYALQRGGATNLGYFNKSAQLQAASRGALEN